MPKSFAEELLTPFMKVKEKAPLQTWEIPAVLAICGMIFLQFLNSAGAVSRYLFIAVPFCGFLFLLFMAGVPKRYTVVHFSKPMLICWLGIAFLITLTSVVVEKNHLVEASLWSVGFPAVAVAWSNHSLKDFAKPLVWGIYISFGVFLLVSVIAYPIEATRYKSFFQNQNAMSLYCSAVYITGLSDLAAGKRRWIPAVVTGAAVLMIICTGSRGGLVAIVAGTVMAAIMISIKEKRRCPRKLTSVFLPVLLAIAVVLSVGVQTMHYAHNVVRLVMGQKVAAEDWDDSGVSIDDFMHDQADRLDQSQGDLNTITTGRVDLWKAYLAEVGLLGNPDDHIVYDKNGNAIEKSSHFTLIQMAYSYGLPAAVLFLAFNIISGIRAVRYGYHCNDEYAIFPAVIAATYGVYYLVESIYSPVSMLLTMMYFMSQAMLLANRSEQ